MATSAQIDALAALYAGYFNRAPDPAGLQFWIDQIDGGREFNTIAADFATSSEATALYPYLTAPDVASPSTFITSIYQNLFNRTPDQAGLDFWTDVLAQGSVSVADMIEAIINGAVDAPNATPPTFDAATLQNKIEVGRDFAEDAANTTGFVFNAAAKSAAIDRLRMRYRYMRNGRWGGYNGYDGWIDAPINNAKIAATSVYNDRVPAFSRLFELCAGDYPRFYAAVKRLGRVAKADRVRALEAVAGCE